MRNEAVFLEMFGRESVRIGGAYREIPTFDNALVFAGRLIREGIVESNRVVASILDRRPRAMSARTQQRHFLKTTGLTYKRFTLIERAQEAVALLRAGRSASDTAFALGFSDQAHLINSLREIMGETPGQIVRATTG
jgi:methylphosphotriester-DNA--protein-cysteine methyltransferase